MRRSGQDEGLVPLLLMPTWCLGEMGTPRDGLCQGSSRWLCLLGIELLLRQEVMLEGPFQLCHCLEKCVFGRGISVLWQVRLVSTFL